MKLRIINSICYSTGLVLYLSLSCPLSGLILIWLTLIKDMQGM